MRDGLQLAFSICMTFCVQATRHFAREVFLPRASSKGASVVIADVDCVGTPESSNIGALSLCVSRIVVVPCHSDVQCGVDIHLSTRRP